MDLHEYLNASSNEQEMYLIKTQLENTKMNVDQLIGEATEYDKKLSLEVKKPKVGAKV